MRISRGTDVGQIWAACLRSGALDGTPDHPSDRVMRYIDTGSRAAADALGTWLAATLDASVTELRCQTGFFSSEPLGLLRSTFDRLSACDGLVRMLIGSNEGATMRADVEDLLYVTGPARQQLQLAVVSFEDGFFHPKTFHVLRSDGSAAAYVGSANLTGAGVASAHVEAGFLLDSRAGDDAAVLAQVGGAVDWWFTALPGGLYRIVQSSDLDALVATGLLGRPRPPPAPRPPVAPAAAGAPTPHPHHRLNRLLALPPRPVRPTPPAQQMPTAATVTPTVPRAGFPDYILFAPQATVATKGVAALTGASLPAGAAGLITQLNNDSARHFFGGDGTANISVPVATVSTIRFGILPSSGRPRAEFPMRLRYLAADGTVFKADAETNIMAYGFAVGDKGHQNVRLLVPASTKHLVTTGYRQPASGDCAILEWPTPARPEFRLTFVESTAPLHASLANALTTAEGSGQNVGGGACWLAPGIAPPWP